MCPSGLAGLWYYRKTPRHNVGDWVNKPQHGHNECWRILAHFLFCFVLLKKVASKLGVKFLYLCRGNLSMFRLKRLLGEWRGKETGLRANKHEQPQDFEELIGNCSTVTVPALSSTSKSWEAIESKNQENNAYLTDSIWKGFSN